jgi:basic membrane protein A
MKKNFGFLMGLVLILSIVLASCAPAAAPTAAPAAPVATEAAPVVTEAPAATEAPTAAPVATEAKPKLKVCQVTDTGGIDDKSFNATAWKGVEDAMAQLGVDGKYLESKEVADFEKNLNAFVEEKCDVIISVGFLLGDATKAAAEANPDMKFSIVDYGYDPIIPNVVGQVFNTDEAAFLAGYLAAGMTKTGKVGTFGGLPIPTVTIFMEGFAKGVSYYNTEKGTKVVVLGYDLANPDKGLFTNSFDDQNAGKEMGVTLMDEGADIIMPVAGPVGLGTAAALKERGNAMLIGVDSDWFLTAPTYADITLTSVLKKMDVTTFNVIKSVQDGTFKGGFTTGDLKNTGVDLAPFHDFDSKVPADLKAGLDKARAGLLDGTIKLADIK